MKPVPTHRRAMIGAALAPMAIVVAVAPSASAEPVEPAPAPAPVQVDAPASPTADPVAVTACSHFAEVLDAAALYYGDFADSLDGFAAENYTDPSVSSSNSLGRTALRQGAAVAMGAANQPGVPLPIADPMRRWSLDATKLLLKMGLHGGRDTLNATADEMNNDAITVQQACAAAGTHA